MWSNTLLWGMFIPIFKLLPLKLRCHWIAQFYEAISLNFRLIKYSDAWKLTFFSLKWSWNDFKVKYAWIEVKKVSTDKIRGQKGHWVGVWGWSKNRENARKLPKISVFGPPWNPTRQTYWPQILSVDTFLLQFKHILLWNPFKII